MQRAPSSHLFVDDASQVGEVRRHAVELAERCAFNEVERTSIAIAATELASNLIKHARHCQLFLTIVKSPSGNRGVELLAIDGGPGIPSLDVALQDGFSTRGTRGAGLGAIRRLASQFDIYTQLQAGTVQLARFWRRQDSPDPPIVHFAGVSSAAPGETFCGDAWAVLYEAHRATLLVVDGLGHGPLAATAAHEAVVAFESARGLGPEETVKQMHQALRGTRGAAASVAQVDRERRQVTYSGVGNVSAILHGASKPQRMVSMNGIVGVEPARTRSFVYPLAGPGLLVMYSDGLSSQVRLDDYPGLSEKDPAVIAGVLYRDFKRGRDDATIVVGSVK